MDWVFFCRLIAIETFADNLTPDEVADAWSRRRREDYHDSWNRMRLLATIVIQPHLSKKITPERLLPFEWDKGRKKRSNAPERAASAPELTPEQKRKRFEELCRMMDKDNGDAKI